MNSPLLQRLSTYDGKSTDFLREVASNFSDERHYLDKLIALFDCRDGFVADSATWLVKNAVENGAEVDGIRVQAVVDGFPKLTSWSAQLHICQTIQHFTLSEQQACVLVFGLRPLLSHKRPFLRAWSLDALATLAHQYAQFIPEARAALQHAAEDPAASVRARARRLSF